MRRGDGRGRRVPAHSRRWCAFLRWSGTGTARLGVESGTVPADHPMGAGQPQPRPGRVASPQGPFGHAAASRPSAPMPGIAGALERRGVSAALAGVFRSAGISRASGRTTRGGEGHGGAGSTAKGEHVEQGPGGHARLLDHQDHGDDGRRDRRGLPRGARGPRHGRHGRDHGRTAHCWLRRTGSRPRSRRRSTGRPRLAPHPGKPRTVRIRGVSCYSC